MERDAAIKGSGRVCAHEGDYEDEEERSAGDARRPPLLFPRLEAFGPECLHDLSREADDVEARPHGLRYGWRCTALELHGVARPHGLCAAQEHGAWSVEQGAQ